jgi:hypothetical protein
VDEEGGAEEVKTSVDTGATGTAFQRPTSAPRAATRATGTMTSKRTWSIGDRPSAANWLNNATGAECGQKSRGQGRLPQIVVAVLCGRTLL